MNFLNMIASLFARPGITRGASLAAAMAVTAKELVEKKVRLSAPSQFEPDLTCGICLICCPLLGRTRLLDAVQDHTKTNLIFVSGPFRRLGSLLLWEICTPQTPALSRKMRITADAHARSAFDAPSLEIADTLLVVAHPRVLSECTEQLDTLSVRSVTIPAEGSDEGGMVRDLESARRAFHEFRRMLLRLGAHPVFSFADDAQDMLAEFRICEDQELRHLKVKIAKLSALFHAGRRALDGGSELITVDDVVAAREFCFPEKDHEFAEKQDHSAEDLVLERILRKFGSPAGAEVPMSVIQTTIRRSRQTSSKPIGTILANLAQEGRLQIVNRPRHGPSKGRLSHIVILSPADQIYA